jgi:hypothetical protein
MFHTMIFHCCPRPKRFLLFLAVVPLLASCVLALRHEEEVYYCGLVLRDFESGFASSFCSSFAAIEDRTSTVAISPETKTITKLLPATLCETETDGETL